jgi:hypothetical protein
MMVWLAMDWLVRRGDDRRNRCRRGGLRWRLQRLRNARHIAAKQQASGQDRQHCQAVEVHVLPAPGRKESG